MEIAERVYRDRKINLEDNKEFESMISNMRYETEQIITEVIYLRNYQVNNNI